MLQTFRQHVRVQLVGRFDVGAVAGRGGMGVVFRAQELPSGRPVALKCLTQLGAVDRARFEREATLLGELDHPRVVRCVSFGLDEAIPWIAMEWVEGESVSAKLRGGRLGVGDAIRVGKGVAEALAHLHANGIIHRDVKPANVLLEAGDPARAVLVDLGVARGGSTSQITSTSVAIGTPSYMAPEQATAVGEITGAADVFALGVLLFHCLTGSSPFRADNAVATLARVLLEDAPRLRSVRPEVPEALDEVVARFLFKTVSARPADGSEALDLLERIDVPGSIRPSRPPEDFDAIRDGARHLVTLVLITGAPGAAPARLNPGVAVDVEKLAWDLGGEPRALADGSLVVTFATRAGTLDHLDGAARFALEMQAQFRRQAVVLTTVRAVPHEPLPVGRAIESVGTLTPEEVGQVRLDAISATLLERDFIVRERPGGYVLASEREETRSPSGRASEFAGRRVELATLRAAYEDVREGGGARAVLITGEAGIGKTRLMKAFADDLPHPPWRGRGSPLTSPSPFSLLGDVVRRRAALTRDQLVGDRRAAIRALLPSSLGGRQRLLAELLDETFEPGTTPAHEALVAARHDIAFMKDLMLTALTAFLRAGLSPTAPLVLEVEDAQGADPLSVELLSMAMEKLSAEPLLLVMATREAEQGGVTHLNDAPGVHRLDLQPLSAQAVRQMAEGILGSDTEPAVIDGVVRRGQGNPLLIEELLRSQADGASVDETSPVLALVGARLEGLAPPLQDALRAAAVVGLQFWREPVERMCPSIAGLPWVDGLISAGLIERRPSSRFGGLSELSFRQDITQRAAYSSTTAKARAVGHGMTASWLEARGETDPVLIAHHWERSDRPARAVTSLVSASGRAFRAGELDAALGYARRATAVATTPQELGASEGAAARALGLGGHLDAALKASTRALRALDVGTEAYFEAMGDAVMFARRLGRLDEWTDAIAGLIQGEAQPGAEVARVVRGFSVAEALILAGRHDLAEAMLASVSRVKVDWSSPRLDIARHGTQAVLAIARGHAERYLAELTQVLALQGRVGDRRRALITRVNLGHGANQLGDYAAAAVWLEEAIEEADELFIGIMAGAARVSLGWARTRLGDVGAGEQLIREGVSRLDDVGESFLASAARILLARVGIEAGDASMAQEASELACQGLIHEPGLRAYALAAGAAAAMQGGVLERAADLMNEAHEVVTRLGSLEEGEGYVRLVHAQVLIGLGDEQAEEAVALAKRRLLERAEAIRDTVSREHFLRIPEHAATLALTAPANPD